MLYTFGTAWDVSTIADTGQRFPDSESPFECARFSEDGDNTYLYVVGTFSDRIRQNYIPYLYEEVDYFFNVNHDLYSTSTDKLYARMYHDTSTIVAVPVGSLVLAGLAPVVEEGGPAVASPGAGSVAYTGLVPVIAIVRVIDVPAGNADTIGLAPTVAYTYSYNVPVASVAISGLVPAVITPRTVVPPVGSVSLGGFAPNLVFGTFATPGLGALDLDGFSPSALLNERYNVPVATVQFSGLAPTLITPRTVPVPDSQLDISGFFPWVFTGPVVTTGLGQVQFTGLEPEVIAGVPTAVIGLTTYAPAAFISVETLHTIQYGISQEYEFTILYAISGLVLQTFAIEYAMDLADLVEKEHEIAYALPIEKAHEIEYGFLTQVAAGHEISYGMTTAVTKNHDIEYGLLAYNPVEKTHRILYSVVESTLIDISGEVKVII